MVDKHNLPKGIHSNYRLLPDHIVCKITQRNNIRKANTYDPALKLFNDELTSDIDTHKPNLWIHLDQIDLAPIDIDQIDLDQIDLDQIDIDKIDLHVYTLKPLGQNN